MDDDKEKGGGKDQGQPGHNRPPRNARRHSESPRSRRLRRGSGKRQRRQPYKERFEGATEDLKKHVYDLNYNQCEQYNKTTKKIAEHVGITYKNGADVRVSIEKLEK